MYFELSRCLWTDDDETLTQVSDLNESRKPKNKSVSSGNCMLCVPYSDSETKAKNCIRIE